MVTEPLAIVELVAQHADAWTGNHVAAMIDALTTRRSRNRHVRFLLLVLSRLAFEFRVRWSRFTPIRMRTGLWTTLAGTLTSVLRTQPPSSG